MRLLSLEVENYRNIASASLTPGRELTVICGNNGQGKTNLLEAIWLLTGGKSFRGGKDAELVRRGEPFAVLKASTLRAQQEEQEKEEPNRVRLTVGAPDSPRPGRTVSVNGGAVKRAASLAGSFPAVVFDPGHLSLVKGAPEGRRKFLDAALCQLYPGYLTLYRRYVRALQQKNALLRHSATGQERPYAEKCALLEVLNVELAAQGEVLQQRRRDYLALLGPPGQYGESIQIRTQVLVGFLDAHKALDGAAVDHDLIIDRLLDLRSRNGHVLQLTKNIGKLQLYQINIFIKKRFGSVRILSHRHFLL